MINKLKLFFENAENGISKIDENLKLMEGMSGIKTRHFYNNLLSIEGAKYLEIGTWKGSSVCSAMYGNSGTILCIDNWSEFGGPKSEFLENLEKYRGNNNVKYIESDCFQLDISTIGKFNIYMYDGEHSHDSHYRALSHFYNCLDDTFIYIVDDWNWQAVRNGTKNAIEAMKLSVLYDKEIRLTWNEDHTPMDVAAKTWWNGIYVAILQKQSI
jgi:hypothetical protein